MQKEKTLLTTALILCLCVAQDARTAVTVVEQRAMNSQDLPAKDAPLTVNEQVTLSRLSGETPHAAEPLVYNRTSSTCPLLSSSHVSTPHHNRMINLHVDGSLRSHL